MPLLHRVATWLGLPARGRRERVSVVEECEQRILYSADLNPALWPASSDGIAASVIVRTVDETALQAPMNAAAEVQAQQRSRHEIVFVDSAVPDAQRLIDGLLASRPAGSQVEVVQLQAASDGLGQIGDVLANEQDLDAIHIVSHGAAGFLRLGNASIDLSDLQARDDEMQAWRGALTADADILLYGCDVAQGAEGQAFVQSLARLTGADVAASTDDTGSAARGGDWVLEHVSGSIETGPVAFADSNPFAQWDGLLAAFVVINTNDSGAGSLRQAIVNANASAGADVITFNIDGGGPERIRPTSALPTITDTVTIDGRSQPGFLGTPLIELRGDNAGAGVDGLTFSSTSDGSIVRGLVIYDYSQDGIVIQAGADNVTLAGNWIGTAGTGTTGDGNGDDGIEIAGSFAIIGGTGADDRNVITNSGDEGITIVGSGVTGHLIQGNYIGVDPDGASGGGNNDVGLAIISGTGNTIGGSTVAARNVISKNREGIEVNTADNVVQGNYIGTDASGTLNRGNRLGDGVQIEGGLTGNLIGGSALGAGNLIAFNAGNGVNVVNGSGNAVLGNAIHANTLLGINLGTAGVTANDVAANMDSDSGANNLQNFPLLTSAQMVSTTQLQVVGTFNSTANSFFRIEFFSSTAQDGTGYGEGQTYLGFVNVTTNGSGNASFNTTLTAAVATGSYVSATATKSNAAFTAFTDTSEFALNVVTINNAPVLDASKSPALSAINEDAGAPAGAVGTLVSNLVDFASPSGQVDNVTDVDAGALLGIAVTGADTAYGAWWYSTNNGSSWNALGAVSGANARLLAADANTRLYFQPNANYSGTLANAITFHAWDQTAGTAGSTTNASVNLTVLDQFGSVSYSKNNGTANWSSAWVETDSNGGGAGGGRIQINGGQLDIRADSVADSIYREANLSGATSATLSFNYTNSLGSGDSIVVQVSSNGGSSYSNLAGGTFSPSSNTGSGTFSADITSAAASNTRIRFYVTTQSTNGDLSIDNVQIAYSTLNVGDTTGLSTATDSASLVVSPVADTPSVTNASTNEDAQSTTGLVISRNVADGTEVTNFKITGITNGTLYKNDGTTQITNGTFITIAEGNAGLKFTPAANFNGSGSLTIQASTSNVDAGLGGSTVVATVTVNAVNDAPTLTATALNPTFTEAAGLGTQAAPVSVFSGAAASTIEAGQTITGLSFTVSGLVDGANEVVVVDGRTITLGATSSGATVTNGLTYNATVSGGTVTVVLSAGSLSTAAAHTLVNGITYQNTSSDNPSAGNRVFTLTQVKDSGGTANSGADTRTLSIGATVAVNAVNDAPAATITPATYAATEQVALTLKNTGLAISDADAAAGSMTATLSVTEGTLTVTAGGSGALVSHSGTASVTITGTVAQINDLLSTDATSTVSYIDGTDAPSASATLTLLVNDNGNTGGGPLTNSDTATINIAAVNDAPVLAAIGNRSVNEGATLSFMASASDADLPSQTLSFSLDAASLAVGMTINASTGAFSWTPSEARGGTAPSVTVTVTDNGTGSLTDSETFTITVADTNQAPVLAAIGNRTVNEGVTLTFTTSATDADMPAQSLSYSLDAASLALGMSINASTGAFNWTPSEAQGGLTPSVTITVTDNGTGTLTDSETFTITVADTNQAPVLAAIGNRSVNEGATLSFTASASDADLPAQSLSYSLDAASLALGMSINASTGAFNWTPSEAQGGLTPSVTITVTDNGTGTLTDSETFTITVTDTNQAPVLAAIGNRSVNEGATLSFTASATDADLPAQSLTYSLDGASIALGMTINASTGVFNWTPSEAQGGLTPSVTITVTDNGSGTLSDSETFTLTVADTNQAPVLAAIGNRSVNEGATLSFTASATDADLPAQSLSYSLDGASIALGMTINASTGVVNWTPSEAQGGLTPSVTVTVTDNGTGPLSDSETFTITVADTNQAPVLAAIGNRSVNEGATLSFTASASDADLPSQALSYSLDGASIALGMTINASTGVVNWTPSEAQGGLTPSVTITVSDNGSSNLTDSETFTITVADTNQAPMLTPIGNRTVNEGVALTFTASATDADLPAQSLSYSLDGASLALGMTINASSGVFSWTPSEAQGGLTPSVTVTVTDNGTGTLTDSETFTITVADTNQAPVLAAIGNRSVNEGATLSFTASASDADLPSQALSYSLDGASIALGMTINASTGVVNWTPSEAQGGLTPSVTVTVTDNGTGPLSDSETFTITVADTNVAPVLAAIGNRSVNEGATLSFTASASDADLPAQSLSYSLDGASLALGMTINASSGVFSWTPSEAQGGLTPSVTVTVTDNGTGTLSDSETFTITVADTNQAPVLAAIGNRSVNEGATLSFTASASDADLPSQTLSYSLDGAAIALGMTINASTGIFNWTPTEAQGGLTPSVTITVSDNGSSNLTDSETFTITVADTNVAPVLAAIGNRTVNEGVALTFTASATDADLPGQTLSYSLDAASLSIGMTVNSSTGVFSWTPTEAQGGLTPSVTITVTDNGTGLLSDSEAFTINVAEVDNVPSGAPVVTGSTTEDQTLMAKTASIDDADGLGTFGYQWQRNGVSIGGATGSIYTLGDSDVGTNIRVVVSYTDGNGSAESLVSAAVGPVSDVNDAPVITSNGGGAVAGVAVDENQLAVTTVTSVDVDGAVPSYSIAGGVDAARFAIDATTGALSFIAAPDFEAPADANADNVYDVTVQVFDGVATDSQVLAIAVGNVNEAPTGLTPALATIDDRAPAGTLVATVGGMDPDARELFSFALVSDAGGRFAIDATTGRLTVEPGAVLDVATRASIDLRVRVTDASGLSVDQTFTVLLRSLPPVVGTLPPTVEPTAVPPQSFEGNPVDTAPLKSEQTPTPAAPQAAALGDDTPLPASSLDGELVRVTGDTGQYDPQAGTAVASAESRPWRYLREREGVEGLFITVGIDGQPDTNRPAQPMNAAFRQMTVALRSAAVEAQAAETGGADIPSAPSTLTEILQDPVRVASVGFTAGFVWWLTRSGGLLTSMLMGVPAWRHLDLLPVVARRRDDDEDDDDNAPDSRHSSNEAEDFDDSALLDLFEASPAPHHARSPL